MQKTKSIQFPVQLWLPFNCSLDSLNWTIKQMHQYSIIALKFRELL